MQAVKQPQPRIVDFDEIVGSRQAYKQSIVRHQYRFLWTYAVNVVLGLWLITSPFLFNYRSTALALSDTVAGALTIIFEMLAFSPNRFTLRWATPIIGIWLLFAPLIFWSPTPAAYLIDTLVGCLFITFSILVPGTPGQGGVQKTGPDQPPGWSYNPSSWIRRWLGIALALVGYFISRYLAARQLGYQPHAWEPFFGYHSSDRVLHSTVSHAFPISDAGFGAVAYILEALAGFMGDRARWRTSPWIVTTFALLVVPLGVTSIVLVILQPMVVHHWCGLCLIAAVGLLCSVPLAVHEIIAMGLFMIASVKQGKNFWRVFWMGGTIEDGGAPDPDRRHFNAWQRWVASVQGVTVPWTLALQVAVGAWLMAAPDVLHLTGHTADSDHLLGAIIVTVAAVATAEVTRTARLLNVLFGIILVIAAAWFSRDLPLVLWMEVACGVIVAITSLPKGDILERYGVYNKFIK